MTTTKWQAKADARATSTKAETEASIELRRVDAELAREREQHALQLKQQKDEAKRDRRSQRRKRRVETRRAIAATMGQLRERASADIAGAASGTVYIVALSTAAVGQMSSAHNMGVPAAAGLAAAIYLEGGAVAAAMTEHRARLAGHRAPIAKALKWGLTAAAVAIQVGGHLTEPLIAAALAIASVVAVVMHSMRSGQAAREAELKRRGRDRARFGVRRWIVAPLSTVRAWRADILVLSATPEAAEALSAADAKRRTRRQERTHARTAWADRRAIRTAIRRGHLKPDTEADAIVTNDADTSGADSGNADTTIVDVDGVRYAIPGTIPDWFPNADAAAPDAARGADTLELSANDADTTVADSPMEADTTAEVDKPDSTAGADTTKSRTRRRSRESTKKSADTTKSRTPKGVDDEVMNAAVDRLRQANKRVSSRALQAETPYGRQACNDWINTHLKHKPNTN